MRESRLGTCYRLLLRLYPRDFREAHGSEMETVFLASVRMHRERRGRVGVPLACARALLDTLLHATLLHLAWPGRFRRTLLEDAASAARHLRRNRGFTVTAAGTLALGIGLNTAAFSVVYSLLLRPLPGVADPDGLVQVYRTRELSDEFLPSSIPLFRDIRDGNPVFSGVAGWTFATLGVGTGEGAERVTAQLVSPGFFRVLGVPLLVGKGLEEGGLGRGEGLRAVVVSERFWKSRLGGSPGVVGRTLEVNGSPWEIMGVAPEEFRGPLPVLRPALWVPLSHHADLMRTTDQSENRGNNFLEVVARLAPGVGLEQARAWAAGFSARERERSPETFEGLTLRLHPQSRAGIHPSIRGAQMELSGVILGVVALLLIIACVNVASLFLAKAQARGREMALRRGLGAPRHRIVAQLLVESLLLSVLAGAAGLVLAGWLVEGLNRVRIPLEQTLEWNITLDGPVLVFTLGVTLVTSLVFGLAPALRLSRPDLVDSLKGTGPRSPGRRERGGRILVGTQVAVSMVLLVCAGLFARNLRDAMAVDLGFRQEGLVLATMDGGLAGFQPFATQESFATLTERVRALPGVEAVGMGRYVPLGVEGSQRRVQVPGYEPGSGESMNIRNNVVGPGYFAAMGIPMVEGREFLEAEAGARTSEAEREVAVGGTPYAPPEAGVGGGGVGGRAAHPGNADPEGSAGAVSGPVPTPVVVNQSFARRFWPGGSALGRAFDAGGVLCQVVGVAADGKYQRLGEEPMPFFYFPWPRFRSDMITLHVRTAGDPTALLSTLRREAEAVAPGLALYDVETMEDHLAWALLPARAAALALGGFGLLCVILLSVGIHGVVALSVARRTREVGVRVALGASPESAARMVMSEEGKVVAVGLVLGSAGAFAVGLLLDQLLYSGHGLDPRMLLGVPLLLAAVAAAAAWGPARRASRIDPAQALREE